MPDSVLSAMRNGSNSFKAIQAVRDWQIALGRELSKNDPALGAVRADIKAKRR